MFTKGISTAVAVALAISIFPIITVRAEETQPPAATAETVETQTELPTEETTGSTVPESSPDEETTAVLPPEEAVESMGAETTASITGETDTVTVPPETGVPIDTGSFITVSDSGTKIISEAQAISGSVYAYDKIYSMSDLVEALGAQNVSVTSSTDIKLVNNIIYTDKNYRSITIYEGDYNVNFNGFRIEGVYNFEIEGGNVTLSDLSAAKTGGVVSLPILYPDGSTSGFTGAVSQDGGNLTIKSGRYEGAYTAFVGRGGTLSIDGGEFYGNDMIDVPVSNGIELEQGIKATIRSGYFHGDVYGLRVSMNNIGQSGDDVLELQISGGLFEAEVDDPDYSGIYLAAANDPRFTSLSPILASGCVLCPDKVVAGTYKIWWKVKSERSVYVASSYWGSVINGGVESFVTRLYEKALLRSADPTGFEGWVTQLKSRDMNGAQVAYGFFFSQELINQGLSDRDYLALLYGVFFDRAPDDGGLSYWLTYLNGGVSRKFVFSGFANSQEWKALCGRYGIEPGSYASDEPRDQNLQVTGFVQRLYSLCLNRTADPTGMNNWTGALLGKTQDGAHVAYGFFFSQEMANRKLSNDAFVEVLYQVLLGRSPDAAGKSNWVSQLNSGTSRLSVFNGFVLSQEFDAICRSYGIARGSI